MANGVRTLNTVVAGVCFGLNEETEVLEETRKFTCYNVLNCFIFELLRVPQGTLIHLLFFNFSRESIMTTYERPATSNDAGRIFTSFSAYIGRITEKVGRDGAVRKTKTMQDRVEPTKLA